MLEGVGAVVESDGSLVPQDGRLCGQMPFWQRKKDSPSCAKVCISPAFFACNHFDLHVDCWNRKCTIVGPVFSSEVVALRLLRVVLRTEARSRSSLLRPDAVFPLRVRDEFMRQMP